MKKKIKYSASSIIIILSLMLGFVVSAENNPNTTSGEVTVKIQDIKNSIAENKEERQVERNEVRKEVEGIKDDLKANKEEYRNRLEEIVQSVQQKREEFRVELKARKEEAQQKMTEMRARFREGLTNIKDENKKISAEKIVDTIQTLNIKLITNLSERVEKIENVLVSIESRINKAEENGLDVSSVKTEVDKAKIAIASAREAISTQVNKVYEVNITDEATLRAEMKKLRDAFSKDIKAVHEKVRLAHEAVRTTATTLAQIPRINEVDITTEVENNNTNNN